MKCLSTKLLRPYRLRIDIRLSKTCRKIDTVIASAGAGHRDAEHLSRFVSWVTGTTDGTAQITTATRLLEIFFLRLNMALAQLGHLWPVVGVCPQWCLVSAVQHHAGKNRVLYLWRLDASGCARQAYHCTFDELPALCQRSWLVEQVDRHWQK